MGTFGQEASKEFPEEDHFVRFTNILQSGKT